MQTDPAVPTAVPRLGTFVDALSALLDGSPPEREILDTGGRMLGALVSHDDWLPEPFARPGDRYRQYALHRDPGGRFSVVSFVWGPGQATPIHDHTVWGLIGMLRGAEYSQGYRFAGPGRLVPSGEAVRLVPGQVEAVSPRIGDIHRVHNAFDDRVSISIHVYGADIGTVERATYGENGSRKPFVSGYSPLLL
ncbi:cysteine dioxygenase [Aquincola sp. MAHUQ-54]|uniref:Cysteine dioxygenase n=1 Tax=Aquincola agrisoli TaxID=3119538 RepID=A0AAW9Q8I3_9BURK